MTLPTIEVYLKTTDLEYVFNPEFEEFGLPVDGFNSFYKESPAIETKNAELSFIAPNGKRPDVKIYYEPEIIHSSKDMIANYGTDVTSELYDPTGQVCELPTVYNEDAMPVYLVIAEAVSDSGINFTYDKTPKFREQETPHVYFDTVKGGFGGTEKRRYTYATADSSVTGYFHTKGFKKIHDFMPEEDLLNSDKIKYFRISNPENEKAISSEDIHNLTSNLPDYPGEMAISVCNDFFVSIDSAYEHIGALDGDRISFPEPGLYISDAADEDDTGLIITVEIPAETNPFSKNVTVKAHTEYTAHINGRIGESGGSVLNAYGFSKTRNWSATDDPYIKVADCDGLFEIAKAALLAGRKVIGFINNTDNQPVRPILFESIVENWFESGMNGIRADAGNNSFLLASDNKLYHMLPSY